jgi:hypothetical protein
MNRLLSRSKIGSNRICRVIGRTVIREEDIARASFEYSSDLGTKQDGTRYVKQKGYALDSVEPIMYSGQALAFDGTQSFLTGITPQVGQSCTVIWTQENKTAGAEQNGAFSATQRFHYGMLANHLIVGVGDTEVASTDIELFSGNFYTCAMRVDMLTNKVTVNNLTTKSEYSFTVANMPASFLELAIGDVAGASGNNVKGVQGGMYCIPQILTNAELAAHYQNPEATISVSNGTLKSAFLPQTTLDEMANGNGYCYLLNENNSASSRVINLAKYRAENSVSASKSVDTAIGLGVSIGTPSGWTITNDEVVVDGSITGTVGTANFFATTASSPNPKFSVVVFDVEEMTHDMRLYSSTGTDSTLLKGGVGKVAVLHHTAIGHIPIYTINPSATVLNKFKSIKVYEIPEDGTLARIINYSNSAMRDNADLLNVGYQNAVVEKDAFGVPTGLTKNGEFEFDGKSYVDLLDKEFTGDWYLDVFMDVTNGQTNSARLLNGKTLSGGVEDLDFYIYADVITNQIKIKVESYYTNLLTPKGIVSVEVVSGNLKVFINGTQRINSAVLMDGIRLKSISTVLAPSIFDSGSLALEAGTRTDAQRAITIPKLMLKHGVT